MLANRAASGHDVTALVHAQGGETLPRRPRHYGEVKALAEQKAQRQHAELESCILFLGQGEGRLDEVVLSQRHREPS